MREILLLDMDGTITESRKKLDESHKKYFLDLFKNLQKNYKIGVVSGSPYNYMLEQIEELKPVIEYWLPCNGTQMFCGGSEPEYFVDMKKEIGENYKNLIEELLFLQKEFLSHNLSVSGTFIQYRGSMLNWCPIGRDSGNCRKEFVAFDQKLQYRSQLLEKLSRKIKPWGLVCTKGGETSFDIYPEGWDKTHALRHFPEANITFIGDSIFEGGNDLTIALKSQKWYPTKGPVETIYILQRLLSQR